VANEIPKPASPLPKLYAYFATHGEAYIVTDLKRQKTTTVAAITTSPEDYGRGFCLEIVERCNTAPALAARVAGLEEALNVPEYEQSSIGDKFDEVLEEALKFVKDNQEYNDIEEGGGPRHQDLWWIGLFAGMLKRARAALKGGGSNG
jgi:hypothetical protein